MNVKKKKEKRRLRRRLHIRKRVIGTAEKPRLSVCRSSRNLTCQLIDDNEGRTLASVSTLAPAVREQAPYGGNVAAAAVLGKSLAQAAQEAGISVCVMDRSGYKFHGRIKALTESAREAGLKI